MLKSIAVIWLSFYLEMIKYIRKLKKRTHVSRTSKKSYSIEAVTWMWARGRNS